ncbi:hypothetical protein KY326_04220 [Candidatus Woesearchaeota archaeon]|nr:hypothetical protein [Candidatus Woesearchaeota archaeon]
MKITNAIRITKEGEARIEYLLNNFMVMDYHKTLLKAIKSRMPKNVSKSDCEIFEEISKLYPYVICHKCGNCAHIKYDNHWVCKKHYTLATDETFKEAMQVSR